MSKKKILPYIIFPAATLAVGTISGLLSMNGMEMYKNLAKPPFSPPAIVFPIVWSVLYILMGIAAARIYESNSEGADMALTLYAFQLFLNFLWPLFFFSLGLRFPALLLLIILFIFVAITFVRFIRIDKTAGILMLPYLIWLIAALYLNAGVWLLNR